jgi:hypothetical protein
MTFKATPRNKDAIYYYMPGCPDMVVINPRFRNDRETVSRFISYLQKDIEQKKRFSKGTMELRESCRLEDLPAVAPDFIIVDLPQDWMGRHRRDTSPRWGTYISWSGCPAIRRSGLFLVSRF